ncbi:MAG: hypothetical protein AAGH87_06215 [Pseudomonadota bacterium]
MALRLPGGWVITRLAQGPGEGGGADTADRKAAAPDPSSSGSEQTEAAPPAPIKPAKAPKRPLLVRIFGLSIWGAVKLLLVCILVGGFVMAWQGAQTAAEDSLTGAAGEAAQRLWQGAVWAAQNFWRPALYGAGVVVPFWVLWRVVTLPFRR